MGWTGEAWRDPVPLPAPVNSEASEWSPVVAADGALYFASDRPGGLGLGDLYRAEPDGEIWRVTALPDTVNSPGGEWNLDLSPDGNTLIFEASHRPTNRTVPGDLYVSARTESGWSPARPLAGLNTDGSDLMPRFVGADRFVFTSVEGGEARWRVGGVQ